MQERISGIYRIRNLLDNKVYIGLSSNVKQRFAQHKVNSKSINSDKYLYNAIQKYGLNNFEFSIIEYCEVSELPEKEIFWIEFYNSTDRDCGYNVQSGGFSNIEVALETREKLRDAQQNKIPIIKLDRLGNFVERYESVNHASKSNGFKYPSDIYKMAIKKINCRHIKNCIYVSEIDYINNNYNIEKDRWVVQFDLDGNYLKTYYDMCNAESTTGVSSSSISMCCNKTSAAYNIVGGFLWCKYSDYENGYIPHATYDEIINHKMKGGKYSIVATDIVNCNIIKFNTIKEASEYLKVSRWYILKNYKNGFIRNGYKIILELGD